MEIQVQELIDKIKKDGIKVASEEGNRIKAEAEIDSRRMLESAKKEADDIIRKAKQEAQNTERAGVAALEQASRNLVLAFKDEIQGLLNKVVTDNVSGNYNDDVLKSVLPQIITSWAEKGSDNLSVLLPENELSRLHGFFNERLANVLSKGVELKSNRKLTSGFRISNKEGSAFYDFSAEAVAGLLCSFLNPKLAGILKDSVKGM
ncbi:MAG: V-type ATP synthase subunit E [Treponema sp.]|nr:V-type ATP synthase subunit E [Treponema sp.]